MMKITLLSSFLFVLIAIVLYAAQADALSHPLDIKLPNIDRSATNINKYVYFIWVTKNHKSTFIQ
jgi:hypothetical protein